MSVSRQVYQLKVEELKALAWYFSMHSINTEHRASRSINPTAMKRDDLINHLQNTVKIFGIDSALLQRYVVEWNGVRDTAASVLASELSIAEENDRKQEEDDEQDE